MLSLLLVREHWAAGHSKDAVFVNSSKGLERARDAKFRGLLLRWIGVSFLWGPFLLPFYNSPLIDTQWLGK